MLYFDTLMPLLVEGIHQPSCQTCLTWNLSNNVLQKIAAFAKILKYCKYGRLRKVLHLVVVPAVGFGFPFRFVWIWAFCYVWIFDFLFFGSNVTEERLLLEMYITHTQFFPYLFNIGNFEFWNHWFDASADGSCPRRYSPAQLSDLSDMKLIKQRFTEICYISRWTSLSRHRILKTWWSLSAQRLLQLLNCKFTNDQTDLTHS